jgi:predicted metal-dependent enzyme (double-stranded beta helix superfamily)
LQGIDEFICQLSAIRAEQVQKEIMGILRSSQLDRESLASCAEFRQDRYTRCLLLRNDLVEALMICWNRGQSTPIHDHDGQQGWMKVVQGELRISNFRVDYNCDTHFLSIGEMSQPGSILLKPGSRSVVRSGTTIEEVSRPQTIHRVYAVDTTISIHVYSRPIQNCLIFDPKKRTCSRAIAHVDREYRVKN